MKICFFGVGGVGGYFGAHIVKTFRDVHEIYFIARGRHKEAICANGLTLKKTGGAEVLNVRPFRCTDNTDDIPECDIIVLAVKGYDLAGAIAQLNGIVHKKTMILPLLNGVDICERIRENLKEGLVFPSCVYVGTHIESPGVIFQKGGSCKIFIGPDPEHPDFYPEALLSLFRDSANEIEWQKDVQPAIWSKFMFVAAYGLVAACYDKSLGEVLENSTFSSETKFIMYEIEAIAGKLDIALDNDIVEKSFLKAFEFPYEARTSFQRDIEMKGAINEGDLFGGTIIRYGERLSVPVPVSSTIYQKLLKKFKGLA
jgi:2-dehydropantoate 2-reductase